MKRILSNIASVALSLVLVMGLFATPAFAADALPEIQTHLLDDSGDSVKTAEEGAGPASNESPGGDDNNANSGTGGSNENSDTGTSDPDTGNGSPDAPDDDPVDNPDDNGDGTADDDESSDNEGAENDGETTPPDGEETDDNLSDDKKTDDTAMLGENESDEEEEMEPLAIGDTFRDNSDEGIGVLYRIIGPDTVQVGTGNSLSADSPDFTVNTGFSGAISIPASVQYQGVNYRVASVADYAFYPLIGLSMVPYSVSAVNLAEGISTIGSYSFSGLPNLSTFSFPASVSLAGYGAFSQSSLTSVYIPEGSGLTAIADSMFSDTALGSVVLPSSITTIGGSAFASCANLSTITFNGPVTHIGSSAFYRSGLTQFTIPATLSYLGGNAFYNCTSLSSVDFAPGCILTELPTNAFGYCASLQGITFPPSLASIESYCFRNSGLTSVYIPVTLTYLGTYAFMECSRLASVTFDASSQMMTIQSGVFQKCSSLTSLNLPDSIRSIGSYALQGCTGITTLQIPRSTTSLGTSTFQECTSLRTLIFRGNASTLSSESSTFYLCDGISTVVYLSKKSKSINFFSSLPTVYYTISYYGSRAEASSPSATPLSQFIVKANAIPENASGGDIYGGSIPNPPMGQGWVYEDKEVGEPFTLTGEITDSFYAYAQAAVPPLSVGDTFVAYTAERVPVTYTVTGVASGTTPGTVTVSAPAGTAMDPNTTGAVTIPEQVSGPDIQYYTVTAIGDNAFLACARFVTITIPKSMVTIGANAFARCTNLTNVFFSSDASQVVDFGIFSGCANIKLVVFGGKKANLSFGVSNPTVYYTVVYYDSKHDLDINNRATTMVIKQRALLGSLSSSDIRSGGPIPDLRLGFAWAYEDGFGADIPLTDSCYVFADGIGFQVPIQIQGGTVATTNCWFKILTLDESTKTGTVSVGLGIDGATAIHQSIKGTPIVPQSVTDAEGNTYQVVSVSDYAFGSTAMFTACAYITSLSLPSTVTSMGAFSVGNCQSIRNIVIPASVASIGASSFVNCTSLSTAQFASGSRITQLPASTFSGCEALAFVGLPASLASIGDSAFRNCISLRTINIPNSVTSIGNSAFYFCYSLTSLELPISLQSVGDSAFFACSSVDTITFRGNASAVSFGNNAFYLYRSREYEGILSRIIFLSKKSPTVTNYVVSGSSTISGFNEYGRNYYQYLSITFYRTISDFNAGRIMSTALVREDLTATGVAPYLGAGRAWRFEPGYTLAGRTTDSYYAYGGYDISQAIVSGVNESYEYTGAYIKPVPTLTMSDGTVLRLGQDYVFDSSVGIYGDGYANNRRQGTASIHLVGINDFAGQKVVYFSITGFLDSAAVMNISFASNNSYTYDGRAKTPAVRVTVTFRGQTSTAVEGVDYLLIYRNNVDANAKRGGAPAQVIVQGMGIYTSEKSASFDIHAAPISLCDIKGTVTIKDDVTESNLSVSDGRIPRALSEGEDYRLTVRRNTISTAQARLTGQGNYTGVVQLNAGISSGTGGGGGGGHGTGVGPGSGPGTGAGSGSARSGTGTGGPDGTATAIGLSLNPFEAELGDDSDPGATEGGGGRGGEFAIYAIGGGEVEIRDETTEPFSWIALYSGISALIALLFGALYRYQNFFFAIRARVTDKYESPTKVTLSP